MSKDDAMGLKFRWFYLGLEWVPDNKSEGRWVKTIRRRVKIYMIWFWFKARMSQFIESEGGTRVADDTMGLDLGLKWVPCNASKGTEVCRRYVGVR